MDSESKGKTTDAGVPKNTNSAGHATAAEPYVTRVYEDPSLIPTQAWNGLLASEPDPSPFLRLEYLCALHRTGCATPATGWTPRFVTLWQGERLQAACALYLKRHSYGEYVFDWAWAQAYEQHDLPYYPKALVAVPFTPVPGARLLAANAGARAALLQALLQHTHEQGLSSLHLLFLQEHDRDACEAAGLMLRHTVQFHWRNKAPTLPAAQGSLPPEGAGPALGRPGGLPVAPTLPAASGWRDFDDFLTSLQQEKRKKIRQERRKVADAGVRFRWQQGAAIGAEDWEFFYRCYDRTYREHGNPPYLNRDFFARMAHDMPENWLLFVAERDGHPIASSLIGLDPAQGVAYGRYWGALQRVDCLHFEACYYQPLQWCIDHGYQRFEGGAQGEHKMARALLPVRTTSAHWLAHPSFADAVERFLAREGSHVDQYLDELAQRSPLRRNDAAGESAQQDLSHNPD